MRHLGSGKRLNSSAITCFDLVLNLLYPLVTSFEGSLRPDLGSGWVSRESIPRKAKR